MKLRWHHWTLGSILLMAIAAGAVTYAIKAGIIDPWVRRQLVNQLEQRTGARVDLGGFSLDLFRLRAEMDNLTLHGTERSTEPALFHADRVNVNLHVVSLFQRKISLDELIVDRPLVYVRLDASGNNLPTPRTPAGKRTWNQTLFDLTIGRLELDNGAVTYNDQHAPLNVRGSGMAFLLQYSRPSSAPAAYVGSMNFQKLNVAAPNSAPFEAGVRAKFTLHQDSFELGELVCELPHSELNLSAELPDLTRPQWNFRYRGRLALLDVRQIFRQPSTPDGSTDFSGDAHYASGQWTANGYYSARGIGMKNIWFHESGMEVSGNYAIAQRKLTVDNLHVNAFGGTVDGKLAMNFDNLSFRTETHLRQASLASVFAALNNENFPVVPLHWDAAMSVDSVNTWEANFQHFRSTGVSQWAPFPSVGPRTIPIAAQIDYDYSQDTTIVSLKPSEISSPRMKIDFAGTLGGAKTAALDVQFHADNLLEWDSFINAIRGPDAKEAIGGEIDWQGKVLGNIMGPTFVGHFRANDPRYDRYAWQQLAGDMDYSPDALHLTNTEGKFGEASVDLSLFLQLDKSYGFPPSNSWSLDAQVNNAPSKDVQEIMGVNYPVQGILSGTLHGSGTASAPQLDSNFTFDNVEAHGFQFDRLRAQLHWDHDNLRLSNAELTSGPGRITGDFSYQTQDQQAAFDLAGSAIEMDKIQAIQTRPLPIGGQFSFTVKGSGPIRAPKAEGEIQVTNLKAGSEVQGNFHGMLSSDGQNAHIAFSSDLQRGKLSGDLGAQLRGDFPLSGQFSVQQFDLDPLIEAGLHLENLTGHSSVNGTITMSGQLARPDTIEADADISNISFSYEAVQLANDQDIRLSYTRNEIRIAQARLHGTGTDLQISGSARFDGDRPLRLSLAGTGDLRLLSGLFTDLEAQGEATVNVAVAGTMDRPQIAGRAGVKGVAFNYADFPVGLSNVNGDFVFDQSRLLFNGLTADAGGGQLKLNGSMTYGQGPIRYDVNATTTTVRIRYPTGMSWLANGTLRLSGNSNASLISGTVEVQRVLFAQGVDVASFFAASADTSVAPPSSSTFLRNLSFDVAGRTTPGARIEWGGAQIDMDGDVRLRGSWDHPVILGHVHLLGGEMAFRGNNYQLSRGDINFSNPFRLDPVLNIEATTTISQYQVTIDFSGPSSRLSLNYRSDPPLPDSDIVALLALGNTGESNALMGGNASQNYGATALLSEAISSGLGGRIEHLFGISHFSVDPFIAGTAAESNAAARVTIQQQVKNDLTITYSTNAATSNQYQLIQVEYSVRRDLSVVFLRDINGTYGMDIKWVKRLK